jgi:hypothetical protein
MLLPIIEDTAPVTLMQGAQRDPARVEVAAEQNDERFTR